MTFDDDTKVALEPGFYRTGFREVEIGQVEALIAEGKTPEEISQQFQVQLSCVKRFFKSAPASSPAGETKAEPDEFKDAVKKATRHGRDY